MGCPIQKGSLSIEILVSAIMLKLRGEGVSGRGSYKKAKHLHKQRVRLTNDWLVAEFDCRKTINSAVRAADHLAPENGRF